MDFWTCPNAWYEDGGKPRQSRAASIILTLLRTDRSKNGYGLLSSFSPLPKIRSPRTKANKAGYQASSRADNLGGRTTHPAPRRVREARVCKRVWWRLPTIRCNRQQLMLRSRFEKLRESFCHRDAFWADSLGTQSACATRPEFETRENEERRWRKVAATSRRLVRQTAIILTLLRKDRSKNGYGLLSRLVGCTTIELEGVPLWEHCGNAGDRR
ncbi:hypothetical protein Bbelb_367380 [Branchiostoma belcheri]|nr:hypothetical protein Bbelb_367380 [Branchiostoma belcheri]